jgi:hypothetical protein
MDTQQEKILKNNGSSFKIYIKSTIAKIYNIIVKKQNNMQILKMKLHALILMGILFLIRCTYNPSNDTLSGNNPYIKEYNQHEIDSILVNNDTTIIYVWTEWCIGATGHFTRDVVPFLKQKPENIGFISLFFGVEKNLVSILENNQCTYPTYCLKSRRGHDKISAYLLLSSFLGDYKFANYIPISLLCNKEGNILNYDHESKEYSHIVNCLEIINLHHAKGE